MISFTHDEVKYPYNVATTENNITHNADIVKMLRPYEYYFFDILLHDRSVCFYIFLVNLS